VSPPWRVIILVVSIPSPFFWQCKQKSQGAELNFARSEQTNKQTQTNFARLEQQQN
jgi:hypothetical protein